MSLFTFWSYKLRASTLSWKNMLDFSEIYYGSRCVFQHEDPYEENTVLQEYKAEGGRLPTAPLAREYASTIIAISVNLPTALILLMPFALFPWVVAQNLWMILTAALITLASFVLWNLGAKSAPAIWVCLAGFLLANCEQLLMSGNMAGVAVSLCTIAVWCFLSDYCGQAGVLLLAISMVLKPHDTGFFWLYLLISGGPLRRRALQTLAVTVTLGLITVIWIEPVSPHWRYELQRNLAIASARGGTSDPGPSGVSSRTIGPIIDLQSVLSVFKDDPRFYNPASYLIVGPLILAWAFVVIRRRYTPEQAPFALAAISVLTLLPVYHRPYDAKLLMLTIPACAILWTERGVRRWIALALTSAGILVTSDVPIALQLELTRNLSFSTSSLVGKVMTVLLLRPAPLVLLALGCFYLWAYIRHTSWPSGATPHQYAAEQATADAAVMVAG